MSGSHRPPSAPSPIAETDRRFPSGAWSGFFQQRTDRPTGQEMHFADGRLTGAGADDAGAFALDGVYDTVRGTAVWTKRYDRYDVHYRGYAEQGSLWGVWTLASGRDSGGFRIWPEKRGRADESTRTTVRRPAVISADGGADDAFADRFAGTLDPALAE